MRFQAIRSIIVASTLSASALDAQAPSLVDDPGRTVRDSRGGGGRAFTIESRILGETRRINIGLPASFAATGASRRYPVVVVVDGEAYLPQVAAVSEELTRHGLVPEAVIVAIENTNRLRDLTPPGLSVSGSGLSEGGDRFLDFIERELLPAVDRQLRGGLPRVFIGHSSGGILATYLAATRPTFRAIVAVDAPIHLDANWLSRRLRDRAARGDTIPLRFAYYGARFPWPDDEWNTLARTAPRSWMLHREMLRHEGHESVLMLAAYLGLRDVFRDYSRLAAPTAPTTSILSHYATIGASLGAPSVPPRRLLRDVVEDLLMEGRGGAARDAFRQLTEGYGPPADSGALLAQIAEVERRPAPTETVEGLLATPVPRLRDARGIVGVWTGQLRMVKTQPWNPMELHLRADGDSIVGEVVWPDAPPGYGSQRLQYLRVFGDSIHFGFMNGMRPRGVLVYHARLTADSMAGSQRFGGISFVYPEGMRPDPEFRLQRRP